MKIKLNKYIVIVSLLVFVTLVGIYYRNIWLGVPPSKDTLIVSGAASLKNSLYEIEKEFEKRYDIDLVINSGSSGTLQKQIERGAPADVFISAAVDKMDMLESKDLIDSDSRINILENKLVLIVSDESKDIINSVEDLVGEDVIISIGTPSSVPVGDYAKESLLYMGVWNKLKDKMIFGKDVLQVLRYVERGEVSAGIVYSSDTTDLESSVVKYVFDKESHEPIVYPGAVVKSSENKEIANEFLLFLRSDIGKSFFERYGFKVTTDD